MDRDTGRASITKVRLPNNNGGSKSSSRFLSGEKNLKKVEPGRLNAELDP